MTTSFTDALLACLPPQSYDRQATSVRREMLLAADQCDAAEGSLQSLILEQMPDTAGNAFVDWERNYGLPDDCVGGAAAPLSQRRLNLLARIKAKGDLTPAYMLSIAASLGYPSCTITEFSGGLIGQWRLNIPISVGVIELTCVMSCDQPLRTWGNTQLECSINRRKPAHTTVLFAYTV
jgi:uncharacterized protein YmfQ (DUF2313 family)